MIKYKALKKIPLREYWKFLIHLSIIKEVAYIPTENIKKAENSR
jgi:hypothetical protein